jgi:hypothetical protein
VAVPAEADAIGDHQVQPRDRDQAERGRHPHIAAIIR